LEDCIIVCRFIIGFWFIFRETIHRRRITLDRYGSNKQNKIILCSHIYSYCPLDFILKVLLFWNLLYTIIKKKLI
jgi:hypothetical protein